MKSETFLRAVGEIDDALILEAEKYARRRRVPAWVRWAGTAAACLVLAVGILAAWPRMKDSAEMAAPEADFSGLADKFYAADAEDVLIENSASSAAGAPSETVAAADTFLPETALPQPLAGWTFYFCDGKTWRTETRTYPGGVPAMSEILTEYLAAAGTNVRCTAARMEIVGEKDEYLPGGIVKHTVGVTTWYITLDDDVSEAILMGLTNTALASGVRSSLYQVHVTMPGGTFGPTGAFE